MSIAEIKEKLASKKSLDRRRAAKEIGKQGIVELADDLFKSYLKERNDARTWETQKEMILALGLIDCQSAIEEVNQLIQENKPHDMITNAAAETYVRLNRESLCDGQPAITLLKFGSLSVVNGCLNPLGYDRMQPSEDQVKELIALAWDLHNHKDRIGQERYYSDPRYGLAAACAGWDLSLTREFLNHCLETGDAPVKYVAEKSLKGKYIKLR